MNPEESRLENRRLNLLLEIAKIGWWEADLINETYTYSDYTAEALGLDKSSCSFATFHRIIREDYSSYLVQNMMNIKEGDTITAEFPVLTPNGTKWVLSKYSIKDLENGKPVTLLGSIEFIDGPKETKNKEYLEHLYRYMPIGYQQTKLIYKDGVAVDYEFTEINKKIEYISGKSRAWILSKKGSEQEYAFEKELNRMVRIVNTDKHIEYNYLEVETDRHCRAIMFSPQKEVIVTLLLDVTDTYHAHEALQESEHLLRDIYDNLPVGLEVFDKNGILIKANEKDVEILGMASMDDYMGVDIFKHPILPLEVKERMKRGERIDFNSSYEFSRVMENYYKKLPVKKGVTNLTTKIVPVLDNNNQIQNYLFINIDNTETTNAYLRIQEFEENFSLIADFAKVGYFKWNLIKKEGFAISQWFKNLGKDPNTLVTEDIDEAYSTVDPEDLRAIKEFHALAMAGKAKTLDREIKVLGKESDSPRWLRCTLTIKEYDPDDSIEVIGVSVDITELKEMILAKDKAEALDKLKSAFLASMSHEIRTPLNAIVGFSDMLCMIDDPAEKEEYVRIIRHNNDLLLKLISDILDLSKIEANMLELNKNEISLKSLSSNIITSMRVRETEQVKLLFDETLPEVVMIGDPDRISQVATNLISNALKFTKSGHVEYGYKVDGDSVLFYVEDMDKIFDRFVKLNSFVQGTGLGLPICQSIVNQMGGKMGVESKLGEGSRFWFTLPLWAL
ncbi:PAS domain-containing protein [Bacteroides sp. 51]|uniref:PAS domain-containing sensor histidine kinase n=1 Tax=Bacteroides sp. 51 TaxID=2302938 RepID=UPI0013D09F39|nr:PAS domain-containing protein [Bacteroides sp. 51]NDV84446.1 PAS domain-containing sensor histidine kinase [Bacteroides sp. 51]